MKTANDLFLNLDKTHILPYHTSNFLTNWLLPADVPIHENECLILKSCICQTSVKSCKYFAIEMWHNKCILLWFVTCVVWKLFTHPDSEYCQWTQMKYCPDSEAENFENL